MCEPEHKRRKCSPVNEESDLISPSPPIDNGSKNDENNELPNWDEYIHDLESVQKSLIRKCMCGHNLDDVQRRVIYPSKVLIKFYEGSGVLGRQALMLCSTAELLYNELLRQFNVGLMCQNLVEVRTLLPLGHSADLSSVLFRLLSSTDKFISYSSAQALYSRLRLASEPSAAILIEKIITDCIKPCVNGVFVPMHTLNHAFDILRSCVDNQNEDSHPLEEEGDLAASCVPVNIVDEQDEIDLKETCVRVLGKHWNSIVSHFHFLISSGSARTNECASVVASFLNLWKSIISVKANLSVIDTKPFYMRLETLVPLLQRNVVDTVWTNILNLLNEVLCYGSTLALQDYLPEEPCNLAHFVIRHVKSERLLERLPVIRNEECFSGTSVESVTSVTGNSDVNVLFRKLVLLVLKAVAVTVKETRCESSSENSSIFSDAGSAGDEADMLVITRSMKQVFKTLDIRVKAVLEYHPETPVAEWVAKMFSDQDDELIESLLCCLDIFTGLSDALKSQPDFQRSLNPVLSLLQLFSIVHNDSNLLLDLLVSNETCFLLYLLRVLKFIRKNWNLFVTSSSRLDEPMGTFIRLRMAINRLVTKNLFPYNIDPVMKLLQKCEDMYEGVHPDCNETV
ncbi:protein lines-like [Artemia franciscana]|uniref:Protein lines n=1 Tax=Artemia franciscana TaxID=6661 RepID=A0AA88HEF8_ARTSF|nr:hypothetical protein QYM36_016089 [Artemia franciscana]